MNCGDTLERREERAARSTVVTGRINDARAENWSGSKIRNASILYGNVEKQHGNSDSFRARGGMATKKLRKFYIFQNIGKSTMRVRKIGRGPKFAMHRFLYGNVEKCRETIWKF